MNRAEEISKLYTRDYLLLNAANFLYSFYATVFIFMPPFLDSIGEAPSRIGFLMATGTLVSVSLKPMGGWVADRVRKNYFISLGAFIAAASTVPWGFVVGDSPYLFLYRVLQGVGYSIFVTFCYGYIASHAPPDRRAEALGVFGLSFFIPTAIGGVLGEVLVRELGFRPYFLIGSVIALASGVPPLFIRDRAVESGLAPRGLRSVLTVPILRLATASLLFGTTFGGIFTFLPVYLYKGGKDGISLFLVFYSLSVIATRTVWRKVTDRADRRKASVVSFVLLGMGAVTLIFSRETPLLILASIITGLGHGFLFPSLSALMVDGAGRENSGMSMALFTGAFDLGLVVGAGLLGIVLEMAGFIWMFSACGLFAFFGTVFIPRDEVRRG